MKLTKIPIGNHNDHIHYSDSDGNPVTIVEPHSKEFVVPDYTPAQIDRVAEKIYYDYYYGRDDDLILYSDLHEKVKNIWREKAWKIADALNAPEPLPDGPYIYTSPSGANCVVFIRDNTAYTWDTHKDMVFTADNIKSFRSRFTPVKEFFLEPNLIEGMFVDRDGDVWSEHPDGKWRWRRNDGSYSSHYCDTLEDVEELVGHLRPAKADDV